MAQSPIAVLVIIVSTLVFVAMIEGDQLAESLFPNVAEATPACSGDSFFDGIFCFFEFVVLVFQVVGAAIAFFFNLITFNIDGAPWFVRVLVGTLLGTGILWSCITLFRGN
jgi:hypothetical protein